MPSQMDDVEGRALLNSSEDDLEDIEDIAPKKRRARVLIRLLVYSFLCLASFTAGRYSALRDSPISETTHYSPATSLVEYHRKLFDDGYGENTTDGRRIYYAGAPSDEIDTAWDQLERGKYVRITEAEARQLDSPTARLHVNGGYIVSLDVYHQLHCVNFLRQALEPDYYFSNQSPEAFRHHVAHCVNDLRQSIQCCADITPMTFERTTWEGKVAYDPQFRVQRTCKNWDKINQWALERSILNDPDIELIII